MHRAIVVVVSALISAFFTQGVLADGKAKPRKAQPSTAPAAPSSNWTGLQTGANGGNSSLAQNFAEPGAFLCPTPPWVTCAETPFIFSGHPSSITAGGFTGYRVQFGGLVVGVEGDALERVAVLVDHAHRAHLDVSVDGVSIERGEQRCRGRAVEAGVVEEDL